MVGRLVVVGGSAGALEPLRRMLADLPADFPAPVLVTMHLAPGAHSTLPDILTGAGPLPARHARHGDPLTPGLVLVAPPDRHLVVYDDAVHLSRGPRENRHRPAIDALFNSAARNHGPAVVGVVLSGALDDGAAGAAAIAAQDGVVIVQEPQDARVSSMPRAALAAVRRARAVPASGLATLVTSLVAEPAPAEGGRPDDLLKWENRNVDADTVNAGRPAGSPVAVGCPECGGGMFRSTEPGRVHYLCHVGHSWSPETLVDAQREASEAALYSAASKLIEEASVLRQLADAGRDAAPDEADDYERRAALAQQRADRIQSMLRGSD